MISRGVESFVMASMLQMAQKAVGGAGEN